MRENTPPRILDIQEIAEEEEGEFIHFDDDQPEEFEEITEAELESLFDDEDLSERPQSHTDQSILTFSKHSAPVFCCSLHPTKPWAVTGGEDDKAYIWNRENGEVIYEVQDHKDTVIGATFSYDGNYLATGDMLGEIQVFRLGSDITKIWEYSMGDMCWLKWHRAASVLLAGSDAGEIYIWRIPSGDCKILPGNGNKCEAAELTSDGKKLFSGYGDGSIKLWDIKSSSVIIEIPANDTMGHKESVTGVACDSEHSLYCSCSEDGKILFISNNGPVGSVSCDEPFEVVALSPYPDLKIVASGTLHGGIAIWDHSKHTLRFNCENPRPGDGITTLKWLPDYTLLVGTIHGSLIGFDARNGILKRILHGHVAEIYEFNYDNNEGIILTASEDHTAKIFRYP